MRIGAALGTVVLMTLAIMPQQVLAWGHSGHVTISLLAIESLLEELPAALRGPEAAALISALGPEPDLSRGAGQPHDADLDPGHFVDLDEQGRVFGVLPLEQLPNNREGYDTMLRAGGQTQYRAGYLPYTLLGGWQQVKKDLAWLRAALAGTERAATAEDREWFAAFARHRARLALQDIGIWSHYVADASQPLHVSVHYNGWGAYPNPRGFTQDRTLHARFEGDFVRERVDRAAVRAAMPALRLCNCRPEERLRSYLRSSLAQLVPLYEIEQRGGFREAGTA